MPAMFCEVLQHRTSGAAEEDVRQRLELNGIGAFVHVEIHMPRFPVAVRSRHNDGKAREIAITRATVENAP